MAIQAKDVLCSVSFSTTMKRWLLRWQKVPPSESRNAPMTVTFPACHMSQASGHQFLALWKQCPSADGAMSSSFYDKVCRKLDLGHLEALPVTPSRKFSLYQQSGTLHISSTSSNHSCFLALKMRSMCMSVRCLKFDPQISLYFT